MPLKVNRSRQNLSNVNALGLQEIKKRLNRCQSSRVSLSGRSILIHEHDSNGGLRVVNVERAANGGQPDKPGASVVVADIERNRQTVATGAAAEDGKPGHCDNIPKPAGFVLGGHARRHGHVSVINGAGEENWKTDSGFLGGFADFNLHTVGNGLRSGVRKDDFAKRRIIVVRVHGVLAVKNGDFRLWRDTHQTGFGLNTDRHAKKRREFAGLLGDGDNGGTLADADNATGLAVQADDIASAETEWKKGFHLGF